MMRKKPIANVEKGRIREKLLEKRNAMAEFEAKEKSAAIAANLMKTEEYKGAKAVMFYAAKGNEVRTGEMIKAAIKEGKTVLLPITNTGKKEIEAAVIGNYDKDLKKGAFGVMEPKHDPFRKRVNPKDEEKIGVIIVPGIAFEPEGHRLGYGLGYYDKLLRRLTSAVKIGLAYDFQIVEKLPRESHDERMSIIVTESGVVRCG